jgi:hypothetical protein
MRGCGAKLKLNYYDHLDNHHSDCHGLGAVSLQGGEGHLGEVNMTTYQLEARKLREEFTAIRLKALDLSESTQSLRICSRCFRVWIDAYQKTAALESLIALADQLSPSVGRRRSSVVITR